MADPSTRRGRRNFLKSTTAATFGTALAGAAAWTDNSAHAGEGSKIKVGLVGCGGRGTGAAVDALSAGNDIELVALGDVFPDRARDCLNTLRGVAAVADRVRVDEDHLFSDFDNYKRVIDACDVVLLATPPYFRPAHLAYAVERGKHVFCEKPVAVDGPGVRSVLQSAAAAKEKGLAIVSGLCWRYHYGKRAVMEQIHDGAAGRIVSMQCNYNTGGLWHRGDNPDWSRMEYQIRNWLYFTWLSGDFIAEQHIHSLDKMAWAMRDEPPVRVTATGGRQTRTDPRFGHIYDHFAGAFEYAGGVRMYNFCRQQVGCANDVSDWVLGSEGVADVMGHSITNAAGERTWRFRGDGGNMYRIEHEELFESIRKNEPINDGVWMSHSTLMAIMARDSAYTGQVVTWEQALADERRWGPEELAWGDAPDDPVPMPGRG